MSYMFEYMTEIAPGVEGTRMVHLGSFAGLEWEELWRAFCKEEDLLPSCLVTVSKVEGPR
jgi:hypothetical protein